MIKFKQYLQESPETVQAAHALGLTYYRFGRWGKNGKVTHETHANRLVPVQHSYKHDQQGKTALTHLEHIDDEPFNNGALGVKNAINTLLAAKKNDDRVLTSTKIDGSPSLVVGQQDGKMYVATKSAFNKTPKLNFTAKDTEANHGHAPGLVEKLKSALQHLHKIGLKGIYQGDVLFSEDDKKIMDIDGEPHITFKPNTIRYAVPLNSEMGKKIQKAKFGIAIHSKYNQHGVLEPAIDAEMQEHPDVFVLPVGADTPELQSEKFDAAIKSLGSAFHNTTPDVFAFVSDPARAALFKQYINHRVRLGMSVGSEESFRAWLAGRLDKEVQAAKSEKGKATKIAKARAELDQYKLYGQHIEQAFHLVRTIQAAKHELVTHFNKHVTMKHFLDTPEGGLEPTDPEGYVTHTAHGPIKLVNRAGFSAANFANSANKKAGK